MGTKCFLGLSGPRWGRPLEKALIAGCEWQRQNFWKKEGDKVKGGKQNKTKNTQSHKSLFNEVRVSTATVAMETTS